MPDEKIETTELEPIPAAAEVVDVPATLPDGTKLDVTQAQLDEVSKGVTPSGAASEDWEATKGRLQKFAITELRTAEDWCVSKSTDPAIFAAAKAVGRWAHGKELAEADYDAMVDKAANASMGG